MKFNLLEKTPDRLVLSAELAGDNPAFRGHFPEVALLPGVVQVDWAMAQQPWYSEDAFRGIEKLKFVQVTPPEIAVTLTLVHCSKGKVNFEYACGDHVLSSGVLTFGGQGVGEAL